MKTINIKGKNYVQVHERIKEFNKLYPNGRITTELISTPDADRVVIKATVLPDVTKTDRWFTGFSQARWEGHINSSSAMENAETSAVGRALGMMGIGILEGVASADEMNKAIASSPSVKRNPADIKMPQRKSKPDAGMFIDINDDWESLSDKPPKAEEIP